MSEQTDWKTRAEAAERTVSVLKAKVRALYNGDQGAVQRQLDRARQREERMRARRALMQAKNAALQEHSARLEVEVAQRTRDIQIILDNVTFGFLVIDRQATVKPGYTRSCAALLGTEEIAGQVLPTILGLVPESNPWLTYMMSIDEVYEDFMPEELTLAQVPGRVVIGDRVLQLEGRTIRDDDDQVEGLLMTISDITALEAARRENQINRALLQILRQKDAFRAFLADCRVQLSTAKDAVADNKTFVRRAVHTIKGNAGSYGLSEIATQIHRIEEAPVIDTSDLDQIDEALRSFLALHREVLEIEYDELDGSAFEVTPARLSELELLVERSDTAAMRAWMAGLIRKPASLLLGPLDMFVARLAERLGKQVRFELSGAETLVDTTVAQPVLRNLSHLIRNALDHGIEPDYERGEKPPIAALRVSLAEAGGALHITVEDDGRGIDPDRIAQVAVDRGVLSAAAAADLPRAEKINLIFHDGLSSSAEATEISGRGVGMSAVRGAVLSSGGTLTVETTLGAGTRFHITLPIHAAANAA